MHKRDSQATVPEGGVRAPDVANANGRPVRSPSFRSGPRRTPRQIKDPWTSGAWRPTILGLMHATHAWDGNILRLRSDLRSWTGISSG